jgi:hypothetical protein
MWRHGLLRPIHEHHESKPNGQGLVHMGWLIGPQTSRSPPLPRKIPNDRPIELALSYTPEYGTEMQVRWVTMYELKTPDGQRDIPCVEFAPAGASEDQWVSIPGHTSSYDVGVGGWNGFIHAVVLAGLIPGQPYKYRAGSASKATPFSDVFEFRSAPPRYLDEEGKVVKARRLPY